MSYKVKIECDRCTKSEPCASNCIPKNWSYVSKNGKHLCELCTQDRKEATHAARMIEEDFWVKGNLRED
jgi:hypothetical protein